MSQSAALLGRRFRAGGGAPWIVRAVYGDRGPAAIARLLDDLCRDTLGAGVARTEFFAASFGSVHGLRLTDGRAVVVKVQRPVASPRFLRAMQTVQRRLAQDGFPAPEPLAGPIPLGDGIAVIERTLALGTAPDAHTPGSRQAMAAGLAELVARGRPLIWLPGLREAPGDLGGAVPWPAGRATRAGAWSLTPGSAWVVRLGRRALELRADPVGDVVLGHADWRAENVRVANGRLSAAYDWDSLLIGREPALVGGVAHAFTANFARGGPHRMLPSLAESLAFLADYETARGAPFTRAEHRVARASLAYGYATLAYLEPLGMPLPAGRRRPPDASDRARVLLAAHGEALLAP